MNLGTPARGLAFIRHIQTEETYRGGAIIVTPKTRDKIAAQQFTVVAVGLPDYCEDDECERHHSTDSTHLYQVEPEDWVLVKNRTWLATPDPAVFVVKQIDVMGKFEEVSAPDPPRPTRGGRKASPRSRASR